MPREVIMSDGGAFAVKVGWAVDQDVQIGVETDDQRSLAWVLWGGDLDKLSREIEAATRVEYPTSEGLARAVLNTLDTITGVACYGAWVNLDRAGCNRLVKLVRKARDAAFGADA